MEELHPKLILQSDFTVSSYLYLSLSQALSLCLWLSLFLKLSLLHSLMLSFPLS